MGFSVRHGRKMDFYFFFGWNSVRNRPCQLRDFCNVKKNIPRLMRKARDLHIGESGAIKIYLFLIIRRFWVTKRQGFN